MKEKPESGDTESGCSAGAFRRHCRILGHEVEISYCLKSGTQPNNGRQLPCRHIADCWYTVCDIVTFLQNTYTQEEINSIFAGQSSKISVIISAVRKSK